MGLDCDEEVSTNRETHLSCDYTSESLAIALNRLKTSHHKTCRRKEWSDSLPDSRKPCPHCSRVLPNLYDYVRRVWSQLMSIESKALNESLNEPLVKHKITAKNMSVNTTQSHSSGNTKLIIYAIGIFFSYLYFGVLQEKM